MQCRFCQETEFNKLALDHINDDGAEFRRTHKISGGKFYQWLKKQGFPDLGLQVLCHNCNTLKKLEKPRSPIWERKYKEQEARKVTCFLKYCLGELKCAACGVKDHRILSLDHVHDDGGEFRKIHNLKGGRDFYDLLRKAGYPDLGLQVLCFNCNISKMIQMKLSRWLKSF